MKSYLNNTTLPRGLRNNNPGNIRFVASNKWNGKVPFQNNTDYKGTPSNVVKEFEQFTSLVYGIRAKLVLLYNDIKSGKNIEELIYEFAPPKENNTQSYINFVANSLKISRTAPLELTEETLIALAKVISTIENGPSFNSYITDTDYKQAIALLDRPLKKKARL